MANPSQRAKPGNSWSTKELKYFKVSVVEQTQEEFFGGSLPAYSGPAGFLQHVDHLHVKGLDAASSALIKRLYFARRINLDQESAVDDFTMEVLRALGYETPDQTVVRSRMDMQFEMCGEGDLRSRTDVCVMDSNSSEILLLVQEDKFHLKLGDPEPQLVAQTIAAFQWHDELRDLNPLLKPLQRKVFPGIIMHGTFPTFYNIPVTADLYMCVVTGLAPATETIIYRHTPRVTLTPGRLVDAMIPLNNREHIMRCFEAFRQFVLPTEDDVDEQKNENLPI